MAETTLMAENLSLGKEIGVDEAPVADLVARARTGDREAFDQLMICHQHRVLALAWRMLGNREEARDAAQETFLRVYRHLGKFDLERDFGAWLYRITVNVCRDQARKRSRSGESEEEEEMRELPGGDDVEGRAILSEQKRLALRALGELSEKQRAALVLRDLEGYETEEVARILGSSPTTVRSQISQARTKLRSFRERWLKSPGEGGKR